MAGGKLKKVKHFPGLGEGTPIGKPERGYYTSHLGL